LAISCRFAVNNINNYLMGTNDSEETINQLTRFQDYHALVFT